MTPSDQVALKIKLEERFKTEIKKLFSDMLTVFRLMVIAQRAPTGNNSLAKWDALLSNHFKRVQKAFRGIALDEKADNNDDKLLIALMAWADENSMIDSDEISSTNMSDMEYALTEARQAFSDEGVTEYSLRELSMAAYIILRRKFLGRVQTIAITETQKAAESTKLMESYSKAGINPIEVVTGRVQTITSPITPVQQPEITATKKWQDVGDKSVRKGHHAYEVSVVKINEPFIVNGEKLMYPGDTLLGATIGNVINCRCVSVYKI